MQKRDLTRMKRRVADSRGREIRNAVAHGKPYDHRGKGREKLQPIQSIVRLILRQYLEFSVSGQLSPPRSALS